VFFGFGIGIVDMVVKSQLAPAFGHFQQMVAMQQTAHETGVAGDCVPEVMGQHELFTFVTVGAYQILHGLDEDARRIAAQYAPGGGQYHVIEGLQGVQTIGGLSGLKTVEQSGYGHGDAHFARECKGHDAVRMQVGVEKPALKSGIACSVEQAVDHG